MTREVAPTEAVKSEAMAPDNTSGALPALPPAAAKADDLDAIRKSVEDAAAVSGGLWISYLFVLIYLAVAVCAVSHVDLFLENPVKLPFLSSLELPIKAFFFLAPLIFCVFHVYTLTYFVMLGDKAKYYHDELRRQIPDDGDPESEASNRARGTRNRLRRLLPSNIFVQVLAGPKEIRSSAVGLLLQIVAGATLVVAPVLLLLLMQLQFLAYHSVAITWTARLALLFDIVAVWWFWNAAILPDPEERRAGRPYISRPTIILGVLSFCVVAFSWTMATFPGEWLDNKLLTAAWFSGVDENRNPTRLSLHDFLFKQPVDSYTRRRPFFLSSTLVLSKFDIFDERDPSKKTLGPYHYVFSARGRDFRGAVFEVSNLSNVDFEGSSFEEASFVLSKLRDTSLFCAHMSRAALRSADLQGTWFYGTDLRGAQFQSAKGPGALFEGAQLEGANLEGTSFPGASFMSADLDAAKLDRANLDGASFAHRDVAADCISKDRLPKEGAELQAAVLDGASLRAASLEGAQLQGASLRHVVLDGTDLLHASLRHADLKDADQSKQPALFDAGIGEATTPPPPGASPKPTSEKVHQAFLTKTFRKLVCTGDPNAIFVLRGLLATERLAAAGAAAASLVDDIESGTAKCPPRAALAEFDRINILKLKEKLQADAP